MASQDKTPIKFTARQKKKKQKVTRQKQHFSSPAKWIEAFCPCCEKTFKHYDYWTGRGKPRFLCKSCKKPLEDRYAYITIHDKQRREKVRHMFEKWDEQIMEQQVEHYTQDSHSQEELRALVPSLQVTNEI